MIHPWQQSTWQRLLITAPPRGHALLLYGAQGSGQWDFVAALARAWLCHQPSSDAHACGQCQSCRWIESANHPDFHVLTSPLQRLRWELPVPESAADETSKKPSKELDIAQVRHLVDSIYSLPHHAQGRVIVVAPAETMNRYAASALLKTLEEPPPQTRFILMTYQLQRLLPTIVSRCQLLAMPQPSEAQALAWLEQSPWAKSPELLYAEGMQPLALTTRVQEDAQYPEFLADVLRQFAQPDDPELWQAANRWGKRETSDVIVLLQKWLFDLVLLHSAQQARYFPTQLAALTRLVSLMKPNAWLALERQLAQFKRQTDHPLAARLFLEGALLNYQRLFQLN